VTVEATRRAEVTAPTAPGPRRRRRRGSTPWAVARHAMLVGICLLAIYPLLFVLLTALKTQNAYADDPLGLPWPITFDNFGEALRGGEFFTWFKNSVILTLGSVALATCSAALAAFAIARMRWRGQNLLLSINVALMIVPPVVILIPLFVLFVDLSLVSTYRGVIMVYAGLTIPFSVYLLTMFFRTVPHEILESALADGASHFRILVQIVLPMSMPALVTLVVVNALWVWNELLIALVFLPSDELKTLMVGITVFRSRYNLDIPVTMAGMLLSSLPMIALYLVGQRYFIRGLIAGAVKG
jgi:raffinose/stachyose/melibiose transport system permease protein